MSNLLINLVAEDNASKTIRQLGQETKVLKDGIKNLDSEMKVNGKTAETLAEKYKLQEAIVDKTQETLDRAKKKHDNLTDSLEKARAELVKVEKQFGRNSDEYAKAEKDVKEYEKELSKQNIALGKAENAYDAAKIELKKFGKEMNQAANDAEDLSDNLEDTGKSADGISNNLKGVVASLGGVAAVGTAFKESLKVTVDFEKQMDRVAGISGATAEEIAKLEDKARELGSTMPVSATQSAEAMEYLALAGYDTADMMASLEPLIKLSASTGLEMADASDLMTDAMSALGLSTQDTAKFLDIVTQTQNNANTSAGELLEAYIKVGGQLNAFGITTEESATALGILANAGEKGAESGTALNAILVNMNATSGQAAKAFKELGISAFDSQGNFKGLEAVLAEVDTATAGMTEQQRLAYLAMIGGKEHVSSLQVLLESLATGGFDSLQGKVENASGALDNFYSTSVDNTAGAISEFKSAMEEAGLVIGEKLLPVFTYIVEGATDALNAFSGMGDGMQTAIVGLTGAGALLAGSFALLGGPLTFIAAGIATLAGGGLILSKVFGEQKSQADLLYPSYQSLEEAQNLLSVSTEGLAKSVETMEQTYESMYSNSIANMESWITATGEANKRATEQQLAEAETRKNDLLKLEYEQYTAQIDALKEFQKNASDEDKSAIQAEIDRLTGLYTDKKNNIESAYTDQLNLIKNKETTISDLMKNEGLSRQEAEVEFKRLMQNNLSKYYDNIEAETRTSESNVESIIETAIKNKEKLTATHLGEELANLEKNSEAQKKLVQDNYDSQVAELIALRDSVAPEYKGLYDGMLESLTKSKDGQLKEIDKLKNDSVTAISQLAEDMGIPIDEINKKFKKAFDNTQPINNMKEVEKYWSNIKRLPDITKTIKINAVTTGNTQAAKAAGVSGFSMLAPNIGTYGTFQAPSINSNLLNGDISNFATNNSSASNVINNIARYEKAIASGALNSSGEYSDNSKTENQYTINFNVDKIEASVEDARKFVDVIDRELKKRQQRVGNSRGGDIMAY